jgi:transposase
MGLKGVKYQATEYRGDTIVFRVYQEPERQRCPECGSRDLVRRGCVWRDFRGIPIGGKKVVIRIPVQRVLCRECGVLRQVKVGFAPGRRRYIRAFERYVVELARRMTLLDVSRHLGVSWDTVKEIQKRHLERRYSRPRLKGVRYLAIDEIAVRKGHKYLTVVLDLERGVVVFVGDGKGANSLAPFWQRLKRSGAQVQAVAIDISPAYAQAVTTHLPQATIVYDRFHLVRLRGEALSDLRRTLQREAESDKGKQVVKGIRWLLLKKGQRLNDARKERQRLETALELNAPLAAAYYLKEDLGQLWEQQSKEDAAEFLTDWIERVRGTGIPEL